MRKLLPLLLGFLALAGPAAAQVDLTGSWAPRLYEDYIERGPGSDLGDFTGMPMTDEARAKALLYTSNLPSTVERQCLPQSPWVVQYRPRGISIWSEEDRDGNVIAIPESGSPAHTKENAAALSTALTPQDLQTLSKTFA